MQWLTTKTGRFIHQVFRRLLGPEAELQELTCLIYALVWGLLLLFFPHSLASSVVFARMQVAAHENTWGTVLVLQGFVGLWAYWRCDYKTRRIVAMSGVMLWTAVTHFLFVDFRPVLGAVSIPLCAIMSLLTYVRLRARQ